MTPVEYGTKYSRVTPGQTRCSGAWTSDPSSVAATPIISAVLGRMIKFGVCRLGLDSRFVTSRTVPCTRQIHTTPRHAAPRDRRMLTRPIGCPAPPIGLTSHDTRLDSPDRTLTSTHVSRLVTSPDLLTSRHVCRPRLATRLHVWRGRARGTSAPSALGLLGLLGGLCLLCLLRLLRILLQLADGRSPESTRARMKATAHWSGGSLDGRGRVSMRGRTRSGTCAART